MQLLELLQPGAMTTVQDLGRFGYQQYGVPSSGAMDSYAYRIGNLLVGNDEGAPSLEITLFGCRLRFLQDAAIAITGADLAPTLNGAPAPMWQTVSVNLGDTLAFPRLKSGCRAYLAVAGGIDVPRVMDSASTYIRAGIGGFHGRALRAGDILACNPQPSPRKVTLPLQYLPSYVNQLELRVTIGPQDDYFTSEGIHTFLNSTYTVSAQADRMGYRLEGPKIQHKGKADIISDGIPLGAVQVPGDGLPIILFADRQTTGGYTKIATVISADISSLAQARPGDTVTFRRVTNDEALIALRHQETKIKQVASLCRIL